MSHSVVSTVLPKHKVKRKVQWSAYGYMMPALVSITVLSIFPMLYTVFISFTNFNEDHFQSFSFVGLENFKTILDPSSPFFDLFVPTFIWTAVFSIGTTVLNYIAGLFLAVLLNNRNMKESAIYRAILILPWAIPSLISILVWQGLLNDQYGEINHVLATLHLPAIPWLQDPFWARVAVFIVNLWLGFPYMMTVVLGALQAVPSELYEAGAIDGATWWQQVRYITIPSIARITVPSLISTFAYNFNNFNVIYLLNSGGPVRTDTQFVGYTDILASASYKMALTYNRFDLSAAIAIVLFVIVGILSLVQIKLTGAFKEEERG